MKRIQLFEFEDLPWFPHFLRVRMTRFLVPLHRLMGTPSVIAGLVKRALAHADQPEVIDLCSGSGGPMMQVVHALRADATTALVKVTLSDLYPQAEAMGEVSAIRDELLTYHPTSVDATAPGDDWPGVRTMICSMHHLPPDLARGILTDAFAQRRPFLLFEISDNSLPMWLWPAAMPTVFVLTLLLTPWIRPMTWQQLVFTYVIPVLPMLVAWDGAVSNARTYTLNDMDELLEGLEAPDYRWERGTIGGFGPVKQLYLLGLPHLPTAR